MKLSVKPLLSWLKDRSKEKSTLATALTVVAACFGVVVTPEQALVIVSTAGTVVSAIAVGTKETK